MCSLYFAPTTVSTNGFRIVIRPPDLEQAVLTAAEGFGQPVSPALRQDVAEHLAACHFGLSFFSPSEEFAGFALYKRLGNILCGGGIILQPAFQAHGLGQVAIKTARTISRTDYLAFRTQSLHMWMAGKKAVTTWQPNPSRAVDPEFIEVTKKAADFLGVRPTVTSGFYGGPLYSRKPLYVRDLHLQAWWDGLCSFENGDAVLCVGRF